MAFRQIGNNNGNMRQFLKAVGKAPLSALLLDYDGTLAPFSVDRDHAFPYPGVTKLLRRIVDAGRTRLVVVTGREARQIGRLLDLEPPPEVWGAHGVQHLRPDGVCEMPEIPADVVQALDEARRWLLYQGLQDRAEIKPGSIAVHWRGLEGTDATELQGRILLGWLAIAGQGSLNLMEFDGGLEIRMPDLDKGDAVRTILAGLGPDIPVAYLGDDAADEHAFRALGKDGLSILVRPEWRKTAARAWLKGSDELLEFLTAWAEASETALPKMSIAAYSL